MARVPEKWFPSTSYMSGLLDHLQIEPRMGEREDTNVFPRDIENSSGYIWLGPAAV